jgi:hypothetical protein
MKKVIDIVTRESLEVLPFDKESAKVIIAALLSLQGTDSFSSFGPDWVLSDVIAYVENNSGMQRYNLNDTTDKVVGA